MNSEENDLVVVEIPQTNSVPTATREVEEPLEPELVEKPAVESASVLQQNQNEIMEPKEGKIIENSIPQVNLHVADEMDAVSSYSKGEVVEAIFEGKWYAAKIIQPPCGSNYLVKFVDYPYDPPYRKKHDEIRKIPKKTHIMNQNESSFTAGKLVNGGHNLASDVVEPMDLVEPVIRKTHIMNQNASSFTPGKLVNGGHNLASDVVEPMDLVEPVIRNEEVDDSDLVSNAEEYALQVKIFKQNETLNFLECPNFHAVVRLKAPPFADLEMRSSLDLYCVLDISGSMKGSKFELLKASVLKLIQVLHNGDRLSITVFAQKAEVVLDMKTLDAATRQKAFRVVEALRAEGGTNMGEGLQAGINIWKAQTNRNQVSALLLFSDGEPTHGFVDTDQILKNTSKWLMGCSPAQWDVQQVAKWLDQIELGMYKTQFVENSVDGSILLFDVNQELLISELSVKELHAGKLMREIDRLKSLSGVGEGQTQTGEFEELVIHTLGFGRQHGETLLGSLAEQHSGMYYYIETKQLIEDHFANCLGGLQTTVANMINFSASGADCGPCTVLAHHSVNDLATEEERMYLVKCDVPSVEEAESQTLFTFNIDYINLRRKKTLCQISGACTIEREDGDNTISEESVIIVDECKSRVKSINAIKKAQHFVDRKQYKKAQTVLLTTSNDLKTSSIANVRQLSAELQQMSRHSSARTFSQGQKMMQQQAFCYSNMRSANYARNTFQYTYNTNAKRRIKDAFSRSNPSKRPNIGFRAPPKPNSPPITQPANQSSNVNSSQSTQFMGIGATPSYPQFPLYPQFPFQQPGHQQIYTQQPATFLQQQPTYTQPPPPPTYTQPPHLRIQPSSTDPSKTSNTAPTRV